MNKPELASTMSRHENRTISNILIPPLIGKAACDFNNLIECYVDYSLPIVWVETNDGLHGHNVLDRWEKDFLRLREGNFRLTSDEYKEVVKLIAPNLIERLQNSWVYFAVPRNSSTACPLMVVN